MTRVKICGLRTVEAGLAALDAGADFLGFVFAPSRRRLSVEEGAELIAALRALRPTGWPAVGLFVDAPLAEVQATVARCGLDYVQLCGSEDAGYARQVGRPVLRSVPVGELPPLRWPTPADLGAWRLLFDAQVPGRHGGTGQSFRWEMVRGHAEGAFLAGGLTPANVAEAIAVCRPWAVDVSSGVERDGAKDPELIRAFIAAAKGAAATPAQARLGGSSS